MIDSTETVDHLAIAFELAEIETGDKIKFDFDNSEEIKQVEGFVLLINDVPSVKGLSLTDGSFYSINGIDIESIGKIA